MHFFHKWTQTERHEYKGNHLHHGPTVIIDVCSKCGKKRGWWSEQDRFEDRRDYQFLKTEELIKRALRYVIFNNVEGNKIRNEYE